MLGPTLVKWFFIFYRGLCEHLLLQGWENISRRNHLFLLDWAYHGSVFPTKVFFIESLENDGRFLVSAHHLAFHGDLLNKLRYLGRCLVSEKVAVMVSAFGANLVS